MGRGLYGWLFGFVVLGNSFIGAGSKDNPCIQPTKIDQHHAAVSYFVHPLLGSDLNDGTSKEKPFKTFLPLEKIKFNPGDEIILAANQRYTGSLQLVNQEGSREKPILVRSVGWKEGEPPMPALIDFKGLANGILIQDVSFIHISNIRLTGNGFDQANEKSDMRCGILVNSNNRKEMTGIRLDHIFIRDVYFENAGFIRNVSEVHSANGTQQYGWGIRVISRQEDRTIRDIQISDCEITDVSHTGIKFTGNKKNIRDVKILRNAVKYTGGPGMQMSEVQAVYVADNVVDHSGSNNESRKWGRGSGIWTWGSAGVLIEKNKFLYANGPGDSDGAHIDYNCENIIIQYNFSAYNAGGFCEILGNNYNCIYRYNISVNDGHRVKGENGAFQEGKTLWLSGFQGEKQKRKGPVNTYIYNNTIYTDHSLYPKLAFDNTSRDVLIANNIFYLVHPFQWVLGDQYKPDVKTNRVIENMQLKHNLFLDKSGWPSQMAIYGSQSFFGDPHFKIPGGLDCQDYTPLNVDIICKKGIRVPGMKIETGDFPFDIAMRKDILGNPIPDQPSIGAIEPVVD